MRIPLCAVLALAACGRSDLLVTSGFADHVYRVRATDGVVLDSFALDPRRHEVDEPHGIAVAPNHRFWYATVSHGVPTLWKYALPDHGLVGRVALGGAGAARIGITPDGRRGFVPDYYRGDGPLGEVVVVALHDLTIIDRIPVCRAPHDAAVDPRGEYVAITCRNSDEIVLLDAGSLEEHARVSVATESESGAAQPLNAVWHPSGETFYVTLHGRAAVAAYDRAGRPVGRTPVGRGPAQLAVTHDGMTLVTANRADGSVSLVDLRAFAERSRVPIPGASPHGIALSVDGSMAYVTYEGSPTEPAGAVAVDLVGGRVRWHTVFGNLNLGIVVVPRGNF